MCLYCHGEVLHWLHPLFFFFALPVIKSESAHKQNDKLGQPALPSATLGVSVSVCLHGSRRRLSPGTLPAGRLMVTCGAAGTDPSDTHFNKHKHKDGEQLRNKGRVGKISCVCFPEGKHSDHQRIFDSSRTFSWRFVKAEWLKTVILCCEAYIFSRFLCS